MHMFHMPIHHSEQRLIQFKSDPLAAFTFRCAWDVKAARGSDLNQITCAHFSSERRIAWWRHQIKTFSSLLALCAGNSLVTGEFPAQRPVTRSFAVFFDPCPNKRLSKTIVGLVIWDAIAPIMTSCNGGTWNMCISNQKQTTCVPPVWPGFEPRQVAQKPIFPQTECPFTNLYEALSDQAKIEIEAFIPVNSSPPSDSYMHQWTGSALVQVMACRLFGVKPLPEPMLVYCQSDLREQILAKFESKF